MPVIKEYSRQVSTAGPNKGPAYSADQFGAQEGRAIEQLGNTVQGAADQVAKRIDQENTSDITQKVTKANADLAMDLKNVIRTAEPGDKKAFEDYNKRVEDTLGKIGEEANTIGARNFYGEASTRIKGQLAQTAADGQAELAGIKAVNDYSNTLNNLSAASLADPSSANLQRELHRQAINNLVANGQLPRHKALELEREGDTAIAKSTLRGWIELNPEHAKKKLKSGEFDTQLGAEGKLQLLGEIDQAERAKEIDAERRRTANERAIKKQQQAVQNDFLAAMVDGKLDTKTILGSNLDAFGSGSKEQFLNMLKVANSGENRLKDDGAVVSNLYARIHLPDGDPNKLTDENELNKYFGNGLGFASLKNLRDEMQGKETEAGRIESDLKKQLMEIAKGKLTKSNPLTGFRDPIGDEQMARFMSGFFEEYKERRAKGESAQSLLNPASPTYLGKNIEQYVRTPMQIMRDMAPKRKPETSLSNLFSTDKTDAEATKKFQAPPPKAPPPRQPNEKPADYLKRIKGG